MILAVNLNHLLFPAYLDNLIGQLFAPCMKAMQCLRALSAGTWPLHFALVRAAAA